MLIQCLSGRLRESFTFYSLLCFIRTYLLCFIKQCIDTQIVRTRQAQVFFSNILEGVPDTRVSKSPGLPGMEGLSLNSGCSLSKPGRHQQSKRVGHPSSEKFFCYDNAKALSSTRVSSGLTWQIQEGDLILLVYNKIKKNHGIQSVTGLGMSQVSRSEVPQHV